MGLPWSDLPKARRWTIEVARSEAPQVRSRLWVHLSLFVATFITVTLNGAFLEGHNPLRDFRSWPTGLPFAVALMSILLIHELGHYFMARYHRVPATLPFFLPAPPFFVGTFGAFIRMAAVPPSRAALFDVGAAGPWAGFFASLAALAIGLKYSEIRPVVPDDMALSLGDSLTTKLLVGLVVGPIPEGHELYFHPIAFAGWVGLLVTLLNLIPIGQLDGGHVVYALFSHGHAFFARVCWFLVFFLGMEFWSGWLVWAFLLLALGLDHPPTRSDQTPLGPVRTALGVATIALLVAVFVATPIQPLANKPARTPAETPNSVETNLMETQIHEHTPCPQRVPFV